MEDLNYEETTKSLDELLRSIQRGYVKDTTKDRAPVYYQAPDFSSENPEKDFEEGMRIIGSIDLKDCVLKAQFVLGCMYKIGINYCPDYIMAETWLQEAIQNGLSGKDLNIAKVKLHEAQQQRRERWMRI